MIMAVAAYVATAAFGVSNEEKNSRKKLFSVGHNDRLELNNKAPPMFRVRDLFSIVIDTKR